MAHIPRWITFFTLLPFALCQGENELKHGIIQQFVEDITTRQTEFLSKMEDMKIELKEDVRNTINDMKAELKEDVKNTVNEKLESLYGDIETMMNEMLEDGKQKTGDMLNELRIERESQDDCCLSTRNDVASLQHLLDTDECIVSSHNCSTDATCTDTTVSFRCNCKRGYEGDGYTCQDKDECTKEHKCNPHASCINTLGSYTCKCNSGFEGDGINCEDVDECSDGTHQCHMYAVCKNTVGSYTCTCTIFHEGDGFDCQEISEPGCQSPYTLYPKIGCIYINERERNWKESRAECKKIGGDLFVANDPEHYLRLAQYFTDARATDKDTKKYMFVGVNEGVWLSGRKVSSKEEAPRNPSMGSGTCSYTDGDTRERYLLWTHPCTMSRASICELKNY